MKDVEIIANSLIQGLENIIDFQELNIKGENFRLSFTKNDIKFLFSCSLHHLDTPWQISCQIIKNGKKIGLLEEISNKDYNYYDNPTYEITPFFRLKIDKNINSLIDKIKEDVMIVLVCQVER